MSCQLYRHYDADDRLLYVGISLSAVQRLGQHKRAAAWIDRIVRVEVTNYPTRDRALHAEAYAILAEGPMFNIMDVDRATLTNREVGHMLKHTLAEAYRLAAKGDRLTTIEPMEFASMDRRERRQHNSALTRIARKARRGLNVSETASFHIEEHHESNHH